MATYLELLVLMDDRDLKKKISTALTIAAFNYLDGPSPTAAQEKWAGAVLNFPCDEVKKALRVIVAANKDASVATIKALSDAAIQTTVDGVTDNLVKDYAAA